MVRKSRGIVETAVVDMAAQVGVRTRARAALAMAAASSETPSKRRKVDVHDSSSPPNLEQRCVVNAQQESVLLRCTSHRSSGEASASCCSSNGSTELAKEVEFADLEDEGGEVETSTYHCSRERREAMAPNQVRAESGMLESTARLSSTEEVDSGHEATATKRPTESELEEFFEGPEKKIQKRFAEKYNYDIVKDEPLEEGRYEWIRLKQ